MIRVAFVGKYEPDSANGVHKTIAGLMDYLPAAGVAVELWHPTWKVKTPTKRMIGEIAVWDLPIFKSKLWNACSLPPATKATLRQISTQVDLVHLHSVFIPENAWIAKLGVPYVLTPNGGYDEQVIKGRKRWVKAAWIWLQERKLIQQAKLIHAVSPPEAQSLARFAVGPRICYIPNAINLDTVPPVVKRSSSRSHLGFMGRLAVEQKGLDLLFQAYARAYSNQGMDHPQMVLAGPDFREGRTQLEQLIKNLGITPKPRFDGPLYGKEKWNFLAETKIFLHPSRWEGMPFALLEAMAMECPVLVTPQTNIAEWITAHDAGWVTSGTPDDIAACLVRAAQTPRAELDEKGRRAREIVREHFSWPKVASQMAAEYQRILRAR